VNLSLTNIAGPRDRERLQKQNTSRGNGVLDYEWKPAQRFQFVVDFAGNSGGAGAAGGGGAGDAAAWPTLNFEVMDYDIFNSDDPMGNVTFPLAKLKAVKVVIAAAVAAKPAGVKAAMEAAAAKEYSIDGEKLNNLKESDSVKCGAGLQLLNLDTNDPQTGFLLGEGVVPSALVVRVSVAPKALVFATRYETIVEYERWLLGGVWGESIFPGDPKRFALDPALKSFDPSVSVSGGGGGDGGARGSGAGSLFNHSDFETVTALLDLVYLAPKKPELGQWTTNMLLGDELGSAKIQMPQYSSAVCFRV
jgi:hypothetical protein